MRKIVLVLLSLTTFTCYLYSQNDIKSISPKKEIENTELEEAIKDGKKTTLKNEFNAFICAGINVRFGDNYNVAISPVDNTVQFEETSALTSGISTGLVWQPFSESYKQEVTFNDNSTDYTYERERHPFAVALLINVFKFSFSKEQANTVSPIDVGFGIGWRSADFLVLFTAEFTPIRQPRSYFIDRYKDMDIPLILANSSEPVRTVSSDDNSLFITKVFSSIGIKIAYSFGGD